MTSLFFFEIPVHVRIALIEMTEKYKTCLIMLWVNELNEEEAFSLSIASR